MRRLARTTFLLTAAHIEFLDRVSARIRRDSGARITKRMMLETLIALLPAMDLPMHEAGSETRLKELLHDAVRRRSPRTHDVPRAVGRGQTERDEDCPHRALSIQLSNVSLATLQLVAAEIRQKTDTAIGMSGVVRALIRWFAEIDLEPADIHGVDDLRRKIQGAPARDGVSG